ncbi:hypothetical protein AAG906_006335 [Vitis piasezkii]
MLAMSLSQTEEMAPSEIASPFDLFGVSVLEIAEEIQVAPTPEVVEDVIVAIDLFDGPVGLVEGASDLVDPPLTFDVLSGFVSRHDYVSGFSSMDLSTFEYLPVSLVIDLSAPSSPTSQIFDIDDEIAQHDSDDDSSSASDLDPVDQRVSPAIGDTEIVDLGTADQPRELRIGSDLSTDERDSLIQLLRSYLDVFAWSYEDMPGLDPSIVQHHLPLLPHARPVKQKLRRLHPRWSLQDGKVRVCVDFRDLNKASPKDDFPLPHIDMLVDSTAGHSMLSFMDGFSGYSKILMAPEDMEKTSFITESNPKKCTFGVTSGKLLGYMVSERGIECERAFERIREYLLSPPVLAPPTPGRPLLLYLSVSDVALGCMLAQLDDSGKDRAIYYLSKRMLDYEARYVMIERYCLALVWATRRLRHYMTEYSVHLISRLDPLRYLFDRPALVGRLMRWLVLLTEFDIHYVTQKSIRGSIVADHLASLPVSDGRAIDDDFPDEDVAAVTSLSGWRMYFDGAANHSGYGIGVLLISPHGDHIPRSVRLAFSDRHPATNNIVEYEACILGLETALELGIRQMEVFGDSNCVETDSGKRRTVLDALATLASMIDVPIDATVMSRVSIHGDSFTCRLQLHAPTSPWPFSVWGIDIIGKISPKSSSGHEFILVAIDYFTKWVEAASYARLTSSGVASFIRSHIICRYGVPHELISDRGVHFRAEVDTLVQRYSIRHHRSSAYRPQTNGALPFALWAYRTSFRTSTGATPYSLVYGMEAVLPVEIEMGSLRVALEQIPEAIGGLIRDPRGKFRPNWSGPYFIRELTPEGAAWLMDLDGNRFSEPTNVDQLKNDPSRVRCSLRIIITHITISSFCSICLLIDIILTLGILRSVAHEIHYTCCISYMRAWFMDPHRSARSLSLTGYFTETWTWSLPYGAPEIHPASSALLDTWMPPCLSIWEVILDIYDYMSPDFHRVTYSRIDDSMLSDFDLSYISMPYRVVSCPVPGFPRHHSEGHISIIARPIGVILGSSGQISGASFETRRVHFSHSQRIEICSDMPHWGIPPSLSSSDHLQILSLSDPFLDLHGSSHWGIPPSLSLSGLLYTSSLLSPFLDLCESSYRGISPLALFYWGIPPLFGFTVSRVDFVPSSSLFSLGIRSHQHFPFARAITTFSISVFRAITTSPLDIQSHRYHSSFDAHTIVITSQFDVHSHIHQYQHSEPSSSLPSLTFRAFVHFRFDVQSHIFSQHFSDLESPSFRVLTFRVISPRLYHSKSQSLAFVFDGLAHLAFMVLHCPSVFPHSVILCLSPIRLVVHIR